MKIILQQDVANVGKKFTVADVPNGYALNKLIPTGKAIVATPANLKVVEKRAAEQVAEASEQTELFTAALAVLQAAPIQIAVSAGENGQLFKALSQAEVAAAAQDGGAAITAEMVEIPDTIKSVGTHTINLTVANESQPFTVEVVAA